MTPAQDGWPEFTQKSPVKVKQLKGSNIESFNNDLGVLPLRSVI